MRLATSWQAAEKMVRVLREPQHERKISNDFNPASVRPESDRRVSGDFSVTCYGNLWRQSVAAGQAAKKTLKISAFVSSQLRAYTERRRRSQFELRNPGSKSEGSQREHRGSQAIFLTAKAAKEPPV